MEERNKHIGIGAAVTFFISLAMAIPVLNLFGFVIGPVAGFFGGAVTAWLISEGGSRGAKYGAIAALVGGVAGAIVANIFGLIFMVGVGDSEIGGYLGTAVLGLFSVTILKVVGGLIGGGIAGALAGDSSSDTSQEQHHQQGGNVPSPQQPQTGQGTQQRGQGGQQQAQQQAQQPNRRGQQQGGQGRTQNQGRGQQQGRDQGQRRDQGSDGNRDRDTGR